MTSGPSGLTAAPAWRPSSLSSATTTGPSSRLAYSVVGDSQGAQDVAQEVFLAAYRRFPGDYEQAAGWVRVAAVHTALNVLRGERRRDKRQLLVQVREFACRARRTR